MSYSDQVSNFGYCTMGHGRCDYEGFYGVTMNRQFYGFHCHDFYEFYMHFGGARQFGLDDEVYSLEPNQLIIVPPFRMHGLIGEQKLTRYERAFLYCSTDFLTRVGCGQIDLINLLAERTRGKGCLIYTLSEDAAMECKEYYNRVMENSEKNSPADRFRDLSYILPLFRIILETMQGNTPELPAVTANPMMHQVLVYINEHYTEPLTLESMSDRFGISVSTLSHEFMRYIHHSVYNYILYKRVMLARQKLFEPLTLSEISYLCGFGDYSNFLRSFKKITGVSPSEYRSQIRLHQKKAEEMNI